MGHAWPRYPWWQWLARVAVGAAIVVAPARMPAAADAGLQSGGIVLGIALVVFSLFGDLPPWGAWLQRLGAWLFPGVAVGVVVLLVPLLFRSLTTSSINAISPLVWLAYLSIILVSISFAESPLPQRIYHFCHTLRTPAWVAIPLYVLVAGLLGNVFDGVTIIAVSVVIFSYVLDREWAVRSAFALLFGGLISNMVTVAAEPTNIKFQDVLAAVLDQVRPAYWFSNWPISLFGIIVPALALFLMMWRARVRWCRDEPEAIGEFATRVRPGDVILSSSALALLAVGIIAHSVLTEVPMIGSTSSLARSAAAWPLWFYLFPAGCVAIVHIRLHGHAPQALSLFQRDLPVWIKLAIIFSLLWLLTTGLPPQPHNVFAFFFLWPEVVRYPTMIVLSLLSSVTDNVALAAMQGGLILNHPLAVWQIRLLFILLTWAGGLTPFGCLQSLALNSRLNCTVGVWLREAWWWAALSIVGGLAGLLVTTHLA